MSKFRKKFIHFEEFCFHITKKILETPSGQKAGFKIIAFNFCFYVLGQLYSRTNIKVIRKPLIVLNVFYIIKIKI
jgi:hypothetical protein